MSDTAENMDVRANLIARAYMGRVAWPTVLFAVIVLASFVATMVLAGGGLMHLALACPLATYLVFASYTVVHEAAHGSIAGQNKSLKWLNDALGFAAAQVFLVSFVVHRKEHFAHHRHTNVAGEDPDEGYVGGNAGQLVVGVLKGLIAQPLYYAKHHWRDAPARTKTIIVAEYLVAVSWRAAFVVYAGWQAAFWLLIVSAYLGLFILLLAFAWIVHRPFDVTERYKDTSTIRFPELFDTVVTWLWLYQNYHSIHHLYPRIPFYMYRKAFAELEPIMVDRGAPITKIGFGQGAWALPTISLKGRAPT